MIRKTIKGGDFKPQMVGELEFDQVPEEGSFNPVTSDAVVKAIDEAKEDMQEKIDEVTLDPSAVALGNVHLLDEVTEFPADGCILIDSETNGPGEMSKDTLLELTAQNALAGNVAPAFDQNKPNDVNGYSYYESDIVTNYGKTYRFLVNHKSGAWDVSEVKNVPVSEVLDKVYAEVFGINLQDYFDLSSATTGKYYDTTGSLVGNAYSKYIEIVCNSSVEGKSLVIRVDVDTTNTDTRCYVLCDSSNNVIEYIRNMDVVANDNATYTFENKLQEGYKIKCSWESSLDSPVIGYIFYSSEGIEQKLQNTIDVFENGSLETSIVDVGTPSTGYYYYWEDGSLVANVGSKYVAVTADSSLDGKQVIVKVGSATSSTDTRGILVTDSSNNIRFKIKCGAVAEMEGKELRIPVVIHTGDIVKLSWSSSSGDTTLFKIDSETLSIKKQIERGYVVHVAVDGDDSNDGSESFPLKSVTAAVKAGAETIIVAGGVYADENLDLSASAHDKITIKGKHGELPIFKRASAKVLGDGSESLVSGYTKVYSKVVSSNPGYTGDTQWLFFDGLDDVTTAISETYALPQQRGKFYRCDCTKIEKTTANTLSDALAEIEAATTYKWWYDSGTHTLYFNRAASTSTYPIYRGRGSYSVNYFTLRNNQSVTLSNLEFRYGKVNLTGLNIAEAYEVVAKCVNSDAISYDESIAVLLNHCEAALAFDGTNGDGINGHTYSITGTFNKYTKANIRDCWSHDNRDDGFSDHGYCESVVEGGLYEWNTKGGITPSYGSHCVCKNVTSRDNYNGFYYIGDANDSGNCGQLMCFNCVSVNNNRGTGGAAGFRIVANLNNRVLLIGCKSFGDRHGYSCDYFGRMELVDCGCDSPVESAKNGTIIVTNTALVE